MSGQQMTSPELNSVHSVKILLCYVLDRLGRPVTEEQLRIISEDSGIINYFYCSDALEELISSGSVRAEGSPRVFSVTEKGRMGSEYFNKYIPLVFRKKLLRAAFGFFIKEQNDGVCSCGVTETDKGCSVNFRLEDNGLQLISMDFYAPDAAQAELICGRIKANPTGAYKSILSFLLDNEEEDIDITSYI